MRKNNSKKIKLTYHYIGGESSERKEESKKRLDDVPESIIHGDDLNKKYKGEKGVYNSADECFVAASYFKDEGFGQFYSILSPLQIYRKALHYIWFGVLPLFYTAPTMQTYHNYIKEVYELIPYVRDVDPDMQDEDSYYGNLWRKERKPL